MQTLFDTTDQTGAEFSRCRTYRYALWRVWDDPDYRSPHVMFIGLNPSTADETTDDATIRKCVGFARRWGYGGIYMLNLYAHIATDPTKLLYAPDPIGPDNDDVFIRLRQNCSLFVACWGAVPMRHRPRLQWQTRIQYVVYQLVNREMRCLGYTQDGSPRHPSRLAYSTPLELFDWERCR